MCIFKTPFWLLCREVVLRGKKESKERLHRKSVPTWVQGQQIQGETMMIATYG
jgi:hypothetical protein